MAKRWVPSEIKTMATRDGETVIIPKSGERFEGIEGLAIATVGLRQVHRNHFAEKWTVYHVPSGWGVVSGTHGISKWRARKRLLKLAPLTDWSRPREEVVAKVNLEAVRTVAKDVLGLLE
jgi:hypothetical protein